MTCTATFLMVMGWALPPELQVAAPVTPVRTPVLSQSVNVQAHVFVAPSVGFPSDPSVAETRPGQGLVASTTGQVTPAPGAGATRFPPLALGTHVVFFPPTVAP